MPAPRKLPRPFEMHWGHGEIVEEASTTNEYHEACIQLMEYQDEEHAGYLTLRFCSYSPRGAFQRSPLMLSEDDIEGMRKALDSTPRLRELMRRLVVEG
jgi:hypothetical protein